MGIIRSLYLDLGFKKPRLENLISVDCLLCGIYLYDLYMPSIEKSTTNLDLTGDRQVRRKTWKQKVR